MEKRVRISDVWYCKVGIAIPPIYVVVVVGTPRVTPPIFCTIVSGSQKDHSPGAWHYATDSHDLLLIVGDSQRSTTRLLEVYTGSTVVVSCWTP